MSKLEDAGRLVLRVAVGGLLLLHGLWKLRNGIGFVENALDKAGLPSVIAYCAYVGEVVAPILVVAGVLTRPAALAMALDMVMAVYLARREAAAGFTGGGGWGVELEAMYFAAAVSVACLGAGRYSLTRGIGRWN